MTSEPVSPPALRLAAVLVGLEAVALVVLGVGYGVRGFLGSPTTLVGTELGALLIVGLGVLLLRVARGLARARSWARSPALVVQLLAALTAFSLAQSELVVPGAVAGAVAVTTLGCLLSRPVRAALDGEAP